MSIITQIAPGTNVRSRDFADRSDCYIEGVVDPSTRDDSMHYRVLVTKVVWCGEELHEDVLLGTIVCPPKNGVPKHFGGQCDFVEMI